MEEYSAIFGTLIENVNSYLPITVIAAIVLFFIREIVDTIKKYRSKKNKIKAISYLLAEEIKLNHWSLKKLFEAYKDLAHLFENHPDALYRVRQTRFGKDHFEYKEVPSDPVWSGQGLPLFFSDQFNKLLPSLAELDFKLTKKVRKSYEEITELEHYRQTFILFVNDELHEEEVFKDMTKLFISDFSNEKNDYLLLIKNLYKALSGKDLQEFRLR